MPLSPYSGYVRFLDTDAVDEDRPIGTDATRAILNNLLYFLDSQGQFRINWQIRANGDEFAIDVSSLVADRFYLIHQETIDTILHPQGGCYAFRVRIGGRNTQATGSSKIRIGIGFHDQVAEAMQSASGSLPSFIVESTTSGSTHAWLDNGQLLTVPEEQVAAAIQTQLTRISIGGAPTVVPVCSLSVQAWASVSDVSSNTGLGGLTVSEWIG